MHDARKKICVLTAGHLATSPRMVKVADSLADAGYHVRLVSTRHVDWATVADRDIRDRRGGKWSWSVVDYSRRGAPLRYFHSGARARAARWAASRYGADRVSAGVAAWARDRVFPELVSEACSQQAAMIFGGGGALAATAEAARRMAVPFALDLEDFHTGEYRDRPSARLTSNLTERIESEMLPRAALLTTAGEAIAEAYEEKYGIRPVAINNTFPLPDSEPDFRNPDGVLQLYWFSQTIGPDRGLEHAVAGIGLSGISAELHLRGNPVPGYLEGLNALAARSAPCLAIFTHPPGKADDMVDLSRNYDIGLAVEDDTIHNRAICLSNKALTYILAGLAVVITDTRGQHQLGEDLGAGALLYSSRDVTTLAAGLARWNDDRPELMRAKRSAWEAAKTRWHWDHPEEKGKLVQSVRAVLG